MSEKHYSTRRAVSADLQALLSIETDCFESDRLSKRSFKYHLQSDHCLLLMLEEINEQGAVQPVGYGLCLYHRGTRLARLYSLAILPSYQGMALGRKILKAIEDAAVTEGRLHMRLEVASSNAAAIALYERCGYRKFGVYHEYYETHEDAVRMQKTIRHAQDSAYILPALWYQQTTDFTCGPAALMMAMSCVMKKFDMNQAEEISIWRESTTIFMTSGLGGTHPLGLALAARLRSYEVNVYVNTKEPLFIEGVRTDKKKEIMTLVHNEFVKACQSKKVNIHYEEANLTNIESWVSQGQGVVILISTYKLDRKKAPHWVLITGIDSDCLYVHDPDLDPSWQSPLDCQHIPIARDDFMKMSTFGGNRLRSVIVLKKYAHP